tara:strand:+ start:3980 stop:4945 length:966 start_codon:yes stop_codon:yes gene_type:complete
MHRSVHHLALTCFVLVLALSTLSCASRRGANLQPKQDGGSYSGLPKWVGQPMSWNKLSLIQDWLRGNQASADPFWSIEGELLLADGRQTLARDEQGRPGTGTHLERLSAAEAGFRKVTKDPRATPEQVLRARSGLRRLTHAQPSVVQSKVVPELYLREQWGARPPVTKDLTRNRHAWKWLTIHHSALDGAERLDGSLAATQQALRVIQNSHMNGQGFGDVGYHFLIGPGGRIFQGRDMEWKGAHVRGDNSADRNPGNIGICVIGNFETEKPTQAAIVALNKLTLALRSQYDIPAVRVRAHQDWKSTACPGKHLMPYVNRLK